MKFILLLCGSLLDPYEKEAKGPDERKRYSFTFILCYHFDELRKKLVEVELSQFFPPILHIRLLSYSHFYKEGGMRDEELTMARIAFQDRKSSIENLEVGVRKSAEFLIRIREPLFQSCFHHLRQVQAVEFNVLFEVGVDMFEFSDISKLASQEIVDPDVVMAPNHLSYLVR